MADIDDSTVKELNPECRMLVARLYFFSFLFGISLKINLTVRQYYNVTPLDPHKYGIVNMWIWLYYTGWVVLLVDGIVWFRVWRRKNIRGRRCILTSVQVLCGLLVFFMSFACIYASVLTVRP